MVPSAVPEPVNSRMCVGPLVINHTFLLCFPEGWFMKLKNVLLIFLAACTLLSFSGCSKKDGINKKYYRSGQLMIEAHFAGGKPHGRTTTYYENGKVKEETDYVHGQKEGISKAYYDTGTIESEVEYHNGRAHGMTRQYYTNKKLKSMLPYKDGKMEGLSKWFHPNGKPQAESYYHLGLREGTTKGFNEDTGQITFTEEYKNDKKILRKEYDFEGKVSSAEHF